SATSTGNSVTQSYEFRLVVTDKLGRKAESLQSVSTQRVVLDIHKNEGVGIGKIRERGVLDVDGEAYVRGVLTAQIDSTGSALRVQSEQTSCHGYVGYFASNGTRRAYVGFGSTNNDHFNIANEHTSEGDIRFIPGSGRIRVNWDDVVGYGSNGNGNWVKYYDGTQICWALRPAPAVTVSQGNIYNSNSTSWTYPSEFTANPSVFYNTARGLRNSWARLGSAASGTAASRFRVYRGSSSSTTSSVACIAIGRWK